MAEPMDVSKRLDTYTRSGKIPGMVVAAVSDGKVIAIGAAGVRKAGDPAKVTTSDKFHIGSITKSMTGTLAAILVKEGKIRWETTVDETFPNLDIHPSYHGATLLQMLSNSAGVPGDMAPEIWNELLEARSRSEAAQRKTAVRLLLSAPSAYPPGKERRYSNGGFTIGGAMLEKATGLSYEDLLKKYLFRPLSIKSAGFGMPARAGSTDQPWGHASVNGELIPVPPGIDADNPAAISPAGRLHISISDLAAYANMHLGTLARSPLDAAQRKKLHEATPPDDNYAVGWVPLERPWGGKVFMHNGTNTMNYAVMWLAPEKKFAAIVLCNSGDPSASETCDRAIAELIRSHLK